MPRAPNLVLISKSVQRIQTFKEYQRIYIFGEEKFQQGCPLRIESLLNYIDRIHGPIREALYKSFSLKEACQRDFKFKTTNEFDLVSKVIISHLETECNRCPSIQLLSFSLTGTIELRNIDSLYLTFDCSQITRLAATKPLLGEAHFVSFHLCKSIGL